MNSYTLEEIPRYAEALEIVARGIEEVTLRPATELAKKIADPIVARADGSVAVALFYGSCLSDVMKDKSSFPDLFLVVEDYRAFHSNGRHALLNRFIPPNCYYFEDRDGDGTSLKYKYCVIDRGGFERETSPRACDSYHFGRFAKRVGMVYARDAGVRDSVTRGLLQAAWTNMLYSIPLQPGAFDLETFIRTALSLSYMGERRTEGTEKIDKIFRSEADYYRDLYGLLLDAFVEIDGETVRSAGDGTFTRETGTPVENRRSRKTQLLIWKTRFRTRIRWFKNILTVPSWIDYLQEKVERTTGERIELTKTERRFIFIFAWKYYFRLKREGKLR